MKPLKLLFTLVLVLVGCSQPPDTSGLLHYPEDRGRIPVTVVEMQGLENFTREGVEFPSKGTIISGDVYFPRHAPYAIVWIPAGGKTKADAIDRGIAFASRGIAALVVDVRGLGGTKGEPRSFEDDSALIAQGGEAYHQLVIYDALRAVDAMRERGHECVLLGGESNGGRIALMAAAIDKSIPGALLMSTAGYGDVDHQLYAVRQFMKSINPDAYAPVMEAPVAYIHDTADPTIPFTLAQETFDHMASSKKMFTLAKGCHGYCPAMDGILTEALEFLAKNCKK